MVLLTVLICLIIKPGYAYGQKLVLNDQGYFETRGVNILVYSNQYTGMFFDEKTAGIEIIHHGVRTSTGGAIRLQNTPEQWDLIPTVADRKVDAAGKTINTELSYKDFNFNPGSVSLQKIMVWRLPSLSIIQYLRSLREMQD